MAIDLTVILTLVLFIVGGLVTAIWSFFWNKYRIYDEALLSSRKDVAELQKDCNMAHNKISLVEANSATKERLEKTMSDFRQEVTIILDKQEQRHFAAITRIEESIKSLKTGFREDLKEIINKPKE